MIRRDSQAHRTLALLILVSALASLAGGCTNKDQSPIQKAYNYRLQVNQIGRDLIDAQKHNVISDDVYVQAWPKYKSLDADVQKLVEIARSGKDPNYFSPSFLKQSKVVSSAIDELLKLVPSDTLKPTTQPAPPG